MTGILDARRSTYTRAFVLRLPMHRALPILLWLALAKLLGWQPPVPQVRSRVIAEANREGLYGMYVTILAAFRPEIACALRVSPIVGNLPSSHAFLVTMTRMHFYRQWQDCIVRMHSPYAGFLLIATLDKLPACAYVQSRLTQAGPF